MDNNSFDRMANTWDENPARLQMTRAVAMKIMDRLDLTTDMNALEIGSGTGLITVQLAPMIEKVTSLELAGFHHCSIEDAHVVEKKDDREQTRCYPMFLATGRKL